MCSSDLIAIIVHGDGLPKNFEEALKWYRKAADNDDEDALVLLGRIYQKGEGVPVDLVESYKYFTLAVDAGKKAAGLAQAGVAQKLTREQMAEAKRLVEAARKQRAQKPPE